VSEATAFLMTSMMADVVNAGTGWQARRVGFVRPAAGKTGTTNDFRDAWFIGYTPHLAAGVWVGYDMPRTIIGNGFAGDLAVPLWGRFMMAATRDDPADWFRPPATISSAQICRLSGKLATDGCRGVIAVDEEGNTTVKSMVYTEYFVRGTEPVDYCPLHRYGEGEGFYNTAVGTAGQSVPQPAASESPAIAPPPPHPQPAPPPPPAPMAPAAAPVAAPLRPAQAEGATVPDPRAAGQTQARKRNFWARFFGRGERPQGAAPQNEPPPPPRDPR
jgi:penicillin-binding protein 1A